MIRLKGELARRLKPPTAIKQTQVRLKMTSPQNPIHFGPYEVTKQVQAAPPTHHNPSLSHSTNSTTRSS